MNAMMSERAAAQSSNAITRQNARTASHICLNTGNERERFETYFKAQGLDYATLRDCVREIVFEGVSAVDAADRYDLAYPAAWLVYDAS